jgi:hypothetical protein
MVPMLADSRPTGQAATATTLAPLVQPGSRCGAPEVKATLLRFPAADGTQLDGVLVGSGPAGRALAPVPGRPVWLLALCRLPEQAGARGDPNVPVAQVQALYRMAPAEDKQLAILGGSSSGLHGWDLLGGANGAGFTPFAAKVASFVSAHTAAR